MLEEYHYLNPRISHLTVVLNGPFSEVALRQCLLKSPQLEDLILMLPPDTAENILDGLAFEHLELLSTNLPHHRVSAFVASHATLTDLCLGTCSPPANGVCPLSMVNIDHVKTLECPLDCVSAARPGLCRLTAEDAGNSRLSAPAALMSISTPLTHLFALTLDFYPDDYDILDKIVVAAPRVRRLKLLEKPRAYVRAVGPISRVISDNKCSAGRAILAELGTTLRIGRGP